MGRPARRFVWIIALAAIASGAALAAGTAAPDAVTAERARLVAAKRAADLAGARAARLDARAAAEQDAARRVQAQEQAVVARIERAEADIAAAQARIALVNAALATERAQLAAHQQPVARLIAALTSFARRPAIAAVAQPGSIDDMVHVRAVLGTVTPAIAARTTSLRNTLQQTRALRASAALAAQSLIDSRTALDARQLELARLEMQHGERSRLLSRQALAASDRALAMGEAAQDAADRIGTIGDARDTAATLGALPDPVTRSDATSAPVGCVSGDAPYTLPIRGHLLTGFGEVSAAGVRSRGLTVATDPGAEVLAPASARVAYARPFGDFGVVVILDHGDGWTTMVTGLGAAAVTPGTHVAQGAPLGRAGKDGQVTVELRRRGRPVDIVPLLG